MSNSEVRVRFTDYLRKHHPKLVQEFSTTHLPPDELGVWAAFKLVVELDNDGYIVSSPDMSFVDDRDPDESCRGTGSSFTHASARSGAIASVSRGVGNSLLLLAVPVSILAGVYYAVERYEVADWDSVIEVLGWGAGMAVLYVLGLLAGQTSVHQRDGRQTTSVKAHSALSLHNQKHSNPHASSTSVGPSR